MGGATPGRAGEGKTEMQRSPGGHGQCRTGARTRGGGHRIRREETSEKRRAELFLDLMKPHPTNPRVPMNRPPPNKLRQGTV